MSADRQRVIEYLQQQSQPNFRLEGVMQSLMDANLFNEFTASRILKHSSSENRRNALLEHVKIRGDRAFDIFFRALVANNHFEEARLLRNFVTNDLLDSPFLHYFDSLIAPSTMDFNVHETQSQGIMEVDEVEENESPNLPLDHPLKFSVDMIDGDKVPESANFERNRDSIYFHFTKPKGLALIINNRDFASMPTRTGTDVDCANLQNLFQQLGYSVVVETNLRSYEMYDCMKRFAQARIHMIASSAIVAVLTHGHHNCLLGIDEGEVEINKFLDYINPDHCPYLAGKPKIIFIQACRGERRDQGVDCIDGEYQDVSLTGAFRFLSMRRNSHKYEPSLDTFSRIPVEADFLVAYATAPYHVSWRNSIRGSWFVQSLCEVFARHARDTHIVDMLTMVINKVCQFQTIGLYKQVPEIHTRLRKRLFFYPGVTRLPDYSRI